MTTMETTEKALKQLLRTYKPLMSEEFWQSSDSSSIYYMDGDLETVEEKLHENYNDQFINKEFSIWYVKDLDSYVAIWN